MLPRIWDLSKSSDKNNIGSMIWKDLSTDDTWDLGSKWIWSKIRAKDLKYQWISHQNTAFTTEENRNECQSSLSMQYCTAQLSGRQSCMYFMPFMEKWSSMIFVKDLGSESNLRKNHVRDLRSEGISRWHGYVDLGSGWISWKKILRIWDLSGS